MANENTSIRRALRQYRHDYELIKTKPCTEVENAEFEKIIKEGGALPKNVYPFYVGDEPSTNRFYVVIDTDLTEDEKQEYLTYKRLNYLKTIKNCVVFFTISAIVGLVASAISAIALFA